MDLFKMVLKTLRRFSLLTIIIASILFDLGLAAIASCADADPVAKPGITMPFKDVTPEDSNSIFISYINQRGIIQGFPDGNYHPR